MSINETIDDPRHRARLVGRPFIAACAGAATVAVAPRAVRQAIDHADVGNRYGYYAGPGRL